MAGRDVGDNVLRGARGSGVETLAVIGVDRKPVVVKCVGAGRGEVAVVVSSDNGPGRMGGIYLKRAINGGKSLL